MKYLNNSYNYLRKILRQHVFGLFFFFFLILFFNVYQCYPEVLDGNYLDLINGIKFHRLFYICGIYMVINIITLKFRDLLLVSYFIRISVRMNNLPGIIFPTTWETAWSSCKFKWTIKLNHESFIRTVCKYSNICQLHEKMLFGVHLAHLQRFQHQWKILNHNNFEIDESTN